MNSSGSTEKQRPTTALDVSSVEDAATHLSALVSELRRRAQRVQSANEWLLLAIIVIVLLSIAIFWQADAIATNFVGDALKEALERRKDLLNDITAKEAKLPNAQRELILLQEARNGLSPLHTLLSRLKDFLDRHGGETDPVDAATRKAMSRRLQWRLTDHTSSEARKVFNAIDKNEASVVVDFRGTFKLNAPMLERLREVASPHGLFPSEVVDNVDVLRDEGLKLNAALSAEEEELASILGEIRGVYNRLRKPVTDAWEALESQLQAAERQAITLGSEQTTEELERLRNDLRRVDDQVDELEDSQRSLTSLAWIPSFSVRAGAVVLALFLVSFFISVYRYNTIVAGFYNSRADVLQVVARNKAGNWIDLHEVSELVKSFSSEAMEFLIPEAPYSAFLEGLKTRKP